METGSEDTGGENRGGLGGHIKLCIVSITVEMDTIVSEDKRKEVNDEQEWAPALNLVELCGRLWSFLTGDKMAPVCKVGGKPVIHSAPNSNAGQTVHEELM